MAKENVIPLLKKARIEKEEREWEMLRAQMKKEWKKVRAEARRGTLEDQEWLENFENKLQVKLFQAYKDARKGGKRKTADEHGFEINVDENLQILRQSILNWDYIPSRSRAHIIFNPVIREIFSACFVDRVVHHLLFEEVYDWWDRHLINDAYACRIGKGTGYGIQRLDHHIRSVSHNYAEPTVVAKFDIEGYFMNLPRDRLYERAIWGLDRQFAGRTDSAEYRMLRFLWRMIIMDDPVKGVRRVGDLKDWEKLPPSKSLFNKLVGFGIVIGNLTSQLLSNIYLDQLDRFITQVLGYKHYGRYVDDFYIVIPESELPKLLQDVKAIEGYLKSLGLTLHPKKRQIQDARKGVSFLGAVIYYDHIVPGRRLKKNAKRAFFEVEEGIRNPDSVASYLGHMEHMDSRKVLEMLFEAVGWEYR